MNQQQEKNETLENVTITQVGYVNTVKSNGEPHKKDKWGNQMGSVQVTFVRGNGVPVSASCYTKEKSPEFTVQDINKNMLCRIETSEFNGKQYVFIHRGTRKPSSTALIYALAQAKPELWANTPMYEQVRAMNEPARTQPAPAVQRHPQQMVPPPTGWESPAGENIDMTPTEAYGDDTSYDPTREIPF